MRRVLPHQIPLKKQPLHQAVPANQAGVRPAVPANQAGVHPAVPAVLANQVVHHRTGRVNRRQVAGVIGLIICFGIPLMSGKVKLRLKLRRVAAVAIGPMIRGSNVVVT